MRKSYFLIPISLLFGLVISSIYNAFFNFDKYTSIDFLCVLGISCILSATLALITNSIRKKSTLHSDILKEMRNMNDQDFLTNVPINLKKAALNGKSYFKIYKNAFYIVFKEKFHMKQQEKIS